MEAAQLAGRDIPSLGVVDTQEVVIKAIIAKLLFFGNCSVNFDTGFLSR